jgi:hypothetical protein
MKTRDREAAHLDVEQNDLFFPSSKAISVGNLVDLLSLVPGAFQDGRPGDVAPRFAVKLLAEARSDRHLFTCLTGS